MAADGADACKVDRTRLLILHDQIVAASEKLSREIEARSGTPTSAER